MEYNIIFIRTIDDPAERKIRLRQLWTELTKKSANDDAPEKQPAPLAVQTQNLKNENQKEGGLLMSDVRT